VALPLPTDPELLLLTLEHMDAYVVLIDPSRKILFINSVISERPREEYIGTDVLAYSPPDQQVVARAAIERAFETGQKQAFDSRHASGRVFRCSVTPLMRDEKPYRAIIVAQDVTDESKAIAREKEMEQRLVLSERLASMGSLASCIAHEINNPLTYVVGNLAYIAEALSKLAESDQTGRCRQIERAVADVREGVDRVRSVVGDLTVLSQPESDSRTLLDVRKVLESSINIARNEIRQRARLERDYHETPSVLANEALLGQVFLNLLLNAARAIPEGSAAQNAIRIHTGISTDGKAAIEIRDTGLSLTPNGAAQIFDPTPPHGIDVPDLAQLAANDLGRGLGVGLGLPICRTILNGFGGEIRAESDGERGAVFRILLPAVHHKESMERRPKTADIAPVRASTEPGNRARILVVDDEPVIASTMRRALEGHDIYIVTSGLDALELCRGEAFDLVLCDLMMPDFTGMDLYEALEKDGMGHEHRLIFMTGGAFTTRARKFLASVPNAWLKKPFDAEEIQMMVARAFERH
jgi:signal transduction histidine kinase